MAENQQVKTEIKRVKKDFSKGFTITITLILAISCIIVIFLNNKTLNQIKNELGKNQIIVVNPNKANRTKDSLVTNSYINKDNIDKDVLIRLIEEVKYYNQVLNDKQANTLQTVIYIVAFFSIIAGFFGYKTIKDIKDSTKEETKNVSEFYKRTFDLLNEQAAISRNFTEQVYKDFDEKVKTQVKKVEVAEIKLKELIEQYEDLKETLNQQEKDNQESKENARREVERNVNNQKDQFKES